MGKTPKQVIEYAKEHGAQFVDFRFTDFLGTWHHTTVPIHELDEEKFETGHGFDGSSIRGWQTINASDMLLLPVADSAQMDPFYEYPTLVLICDVFDPITRESYSRNPRYVAQKALQYMKSSGIADTAFFGPEPEFFVFDNVQYKDGPNVQFYHVDSVEGFWNTDRDEEPNLGYKVRAKGGYFPVPPNDTLQDIRAEMALEMAAVGIHIETVHHEVATAGQCEIDMRFADMMTMADWLQWYKYIVRNVAARHGKTATFMPKPITGDNGSGMHTHMSLWKSGKPLFAGDGYAGMSQMGLWYIGGIKKHARALAAFTNPTTNSYKRLVPGFEAPVSIAHSSRNRSASIRIPMYSPSPKAKRMEARFPDPLMNPYIGFAALLMAGLDGIENKIDPGEPMDKDLYALSPEELADIPQMPGDLEQALNALKADHEFLLKGDVFTEDVIQMWIEYKMEKEVTPVRMRPHPKEFDLYYDA